MSQPVDFPRLIEPSPAKPWWQSRTILGALVVMLAQVARLAGLEIDSAALTDVLLGLAELAGAALTLYGRLRATQPVRWRRAD